MSSLGGPYSPDHGARADDVTFLPPQGRGEHESYPQTGVDDDPWAGGLREYLEEADFETELTEFLRHSAPETELAAELAAEPAAEPSALTVPLRRTRHRRVRPVRPGPWARIRMLASIVLTVISAAVFITVSALSGAVLYAPLSYLAVPTARDMAPLWPLLIYGPWLTGVLCVLRRPAARRGQVRTAWLILLLFSAVALTLSVIAAPKTVTGVMTAALPPIAALACIRLFVPPHPPAPRPNPPKHANRYV